MGSRDRAVDGSSPATRLKKRTRTQIVLGKATLVLRRRIGEDEQVMDRNLRMKMVGGVFPVHEVGAMVLLPALGEVMTGTVELNLGGL